MTLNTFEYNGFVFTPHSNMRATFGNETISENCRNVFSASSMNRLSNITIPSHVMHGSDEYTVDLVMQNALCLFKELEILFIPNTIEQIGLDAFYGCENLKEVIFEEKPQLKTLGWRVFGSCPKLERIIIPSSVVEINNNLFWNYTSLSLIIYCGKGNFEHNEIFYPSSTAKTETLKIFVVHGLYRSKYFGNMNVISTSHCINDPSIKAKYKTCSVKHFQGTVIVYFPNK